MSNNLHSHSQSVFRTEAWTQAWLDTWGKDISKGLIDLGGRGNPLEMLYRIPHRFKRVMPVSVLCLVGNGFGTLSTPRSEYNDISDLIRESGSIHELSKELHKLPWQQMCLTDIAAGYQEEDDVLSLIDFEPWGNHLIKEEPGYSIENMDFDHYLAKLGKSTRLAFFNRRSRLEKHGEVQRQQYSLIEIEQFFQLLNDFHIQRWGNPCYSGQSMNFMKNFCQRLIDSGGEAVPEAIMVDGQPVSVLFDVIWQNRRYNLQSGYHEHFAHKIPLGSLHLGYAIEDTLKARQNYDFLAGQGKKTDYKERIATHTTLLRSHIATRSYWKIVKSVQIKAQHRLNKMSHHQ
ncbi:GNAT family N-acetyltransferase [Marinimicrobium sp. C2-29]|uniref:GNAT family N-acetyltransferase n=1 Tax=Marinimicrobium sp. C2-29 TaxID=3139825 RepID=UPI0031397D85